MQFQFTCFIMAVATLTSFTNAIPQQPQASEGTVRVPLWSYSTRTKTFSYEQTIDVTAHQLNSRQSREWAPDSYQLWNCDTRTCRFVCFTSLHENQLWPRAENAREPPVTLEKRQSNSNLLLDVDWYCPGCVSGDDLFDQVSG
jgi:hypothetical protein